jgi:serine/threonine-protein kinase
LDFMGDVAESFCPTCDRVVEGVQGRCATCGTALVLLRTAQDDPRIGQELDGRYTLRARLGAGGMGTVYRAWQHSMGREVALKVISGGMAHDTSIVRRFLREAKLASSLAHPNIVSVFDFGQAPDGTLYLAMELLAGRTLGQVLLQEGPLPPERAVHVGLQLCDALEAAHARGIVHRDLKPANVVVLDEPRGRDLIKVVDFGLARSLTAEGQRLTGSHVMMGTANYIAPEEIRGEDAGPAADLYALGAILHELLTGEAPFGQDRFSAIIERQLTTSPARAPGPAALAELVSRLLTLEPEGRPASAATTRELLAGCLEILSFGNSRTLASPIRVRRHQMLRLLGGALLVAGLGGFAVITLESQGRKPPPQPLGVPTTSAPALTAPALTAPPAAAADASVAEAPPVHTPDAQPTLRPRDELIRTLER